MAGSSTHQTTGEAPTRSERPCRLCVGVVPRGSDPLAEALASFKAVRQNIALAEEWGALAQEGHLGSCRGLGRRIPLGSCSHYHGWVMDTRRGWVRRTCPCCGGGCPVCDARRPGPQEEHPQEEIPMLETRARKRKHGTQMEQQIEIIQTPPAVPLAHPANPPGGIPIGLAWVRQQEEAELGRARRAMQEGPSREDLMRPWTASERREEESEEAWSRRICDERMARLQQEIQNPEVQPMIEAAAHRLETALERHGWTEETQGLFREYQVWSREQTAEARLPGRWRDWKVERAQTPDGTVLPVWRWRPEP